MNAKRWVGEGLLVFVFGSLGVMGFRSLRGGAAQAESTPRLEPTSSPAPMTPPVQSGEESSVGRPPGPGRPKPAVPAPEPERVQTPAQATPESNGHLVVYYFYGNRRCYSCVTIQRLTQKALEQGFPDELRRGKIEWRPTNVETPETQHFIADYRLSSQSVILSQIKNGQQVGWQNLQQVWYLLGNEEEFIAYVQDGIRAALRAL
ncbi:MAG TPA: nitrophenyl compound nitroreductase subunit ArsF family protein [Candidatus Latescibacteria bacterium]|nr:nitrophenyl compound nitroreductase subunit ArsF family protein [Candidatus Latescibacterota bacterium]